MQCLKWRWSSSCSSRWSHCYPDCWFFRWSWFDREDTFPAKQDHQIWSVYRIFKSINSLTPQQPPFKIQSFDSTSTLFHSTYEIIRHHDPILDWSGTVDGEFELQFLLLPTLRSLPLYTFSWSLLLFSDLEVTFDHDLMDSRHKEYLRQPFDPSWDEEETRQTRGQEMRRKCDVEEQEITHLTHGRRRSMYEDWTLPLLSDWINSSWLITISIMIE